MNFRYIILFCLALGQSLFAQRSPQKFVGTYEISQACFESFDNRPLDTLSYQLFITESPTDTADLEMTFQFQSQYISGIVEYPIHANISNDSTFAIHKRLLNPNETFQYITTMGYITGDSIFIEYSNGGYYGVYECYCKGLKTMGVSVQEAYISKSINLFPNPTEQLLHFKYDAPNFPSFKKYLIYNLDGKLLFEKEMNDLTTIDVSELVSGTYFISFINESSKIGVSRFVKLP